MGKLPSEVPADLPVSGLDSQAPQKLLGAMEEPVLGSLDCLQGHQVLSLGHLRHCWMSQTLAQAQKKRGRKEKAPSGSGKNESPWLAQAGGLVASGLASWKL